MVRRDGRVAEGARLESVYTLTGIGGSNPSLSAIPCTRFDSRKAYNSGLCHIDSTGIRNLPTAAVAHGYRR